MNGPIRYRRGYRHDARPRDAVRGVLPATWTADAAGQTIAYHNLNETEISTSRVSLSLKPKELEDAGPMG